MSVSLNALFNPSYEMLLKLLEINLERFVCYAKENENIYRFIDEKGAKSIFDIQHFLSSPIVITLAGNNLSIFIDGFLLKVAKPYNKKIDENFLNEEVKTFASLNKLFFKILILILIL